jgi:hypothetical protein
VLLVLRRIRVVSVGVRVLNPVVFAVSDELDLLVLRVLTAILLAFGLRVVKTCSSLPSLSLKSPELVFRPIDQMIITFILAHINLDFAALDLSADGLRLETIDSSILRLF